MKRLETQAGNTHNLINRVRCVRHFPDSKNQGSYRSWKSWKSWNSISISNVRPGELLENQDKLWNSWEMTSQMSKMKLLHILSSQQNALQSINLDIFTAYFTSLVSHFKEARLYILFYMVTKNQRMEHFLKQTLYKPGEVSGQPKILITSSLLNPESHFL